LGHGEVLVVQKCFSPGALQDEAVGSRLQAAGCRIAAID